MRGLVLGGGGREHILVERLKGSRGIERVDCLPGNGGIGGVARCISDIDLEDVARICEYVKEEGVDYVVVGSEVPLVLGIGDELRRMGVKCLGVGSEAAKLEGSKAYGKEFLRRHGIGHAGYEIFEDFEGGLKYMRGIKEYPVVIKYDGLAGGKGVKIVGGFEEGEGFLEDIFKEGRFGVGFESRVVIEEYLEGRELSVFCLLDGERMKRLMSVQDYKRGVGGLNTGGMGCYGPVELREEEERGVQEVCDRTLEGLKRDGIEYKGVLYIGLMIEEGGGVKVLEYNVRFGDPESQLIWSLLRTDLVDIVEAVECGSLGELELEWRVGLGLVVVLVSRGYPVGYEVGYEVTGLEEVGEGIQIYHAGTRVSGGRVWSSGGRVLNLVGVGSDLGELRRRVYEGVGKVKYENKDYRRDIGG